MLWIVGMALAAAPATVTVVDGALWPGRAAVIEVGSLSGSTTSAPRADQPRLEVRGGSITEGTLARAGVWRWQLVPDLDAADVHVVVDGADHAFPVEPPPISSLAVPTGPVDVWVGNGEVSFVVSGADPPPVDAIEVVPAEGQVVSVVAGERGLEVRIALEDRVFPRWVPVAVWDRRRDEQPAWVDVRVRARPRVPLVAEPGAKLTLRVGGRTYGPFVAGPDGAIEARVEQNPGDVSASAVLVDDLGNETHAEVPLVGPSGPAILATSSGELLPGRTPPALFVRALDPSGGAPRASPVCRTPAGELPARLLQAPPRGSGATWLVPLPVGTDTVDLRARCTVGASTAEARIPVAAVPVWLGLRVWPDELLADLPVSEVSVVLDDARGERMEVASGLRVEAKHGRVALAPDGGLVVRGEYDGTAAVEAGADDVTARWFAPPGSGPVEELVLRWGAVPRAEGSVQLHVRALDHARRPLVGVPVGLKLGSAEASVTTGDGGWATAELLVRSSGQLLLAEASAGRAVHRAVLLPGEPASGGPGEADLAATQELRVKPGRVRGISIEVDPTILRAGPGAVAWVYVRLEDSAGQAVTDEPVEIEADEGSVGTPRVREDGTWVAEYTPAAAEEAREVRITARTSTVRSSAHLALEPRVVRIAFGPWIGGRTNFGALPGPTGGFDADFRLRSRLIGESVVVRLGVSATQLESHVDTGVGPPVDLRSTLVPLTAALLFRADFGRVGVWGGGGPLVGPDFVQVRFGDRVVTRGQSWLVGAMLTGAVAVRAPGGEVDFTVMGSFLPAPRSDVGYSGNLGSLAAGVGYRLVY